MTLYSYLKYIKILFASITKSLKVDKSEIFIE